MNQVLASNYGASNAEPPPAMRTNRSATPWRVSLWKDLSQVKQAVVVIALGLLGCQAFVFFVSQAFGPPNVLESLASRLLVFCGLAPLLVVLACAGMLIGHERQTKTWDWHSSLPVSWQRSLGSKLLVTFGYAVLATLPLLLLPLIAQRMFGGVFHPAGDGIATVAVVSLWILNIAVWMFVFALLIEETLIALIAGGAFVFALQALAWTVAALSRGWTSNTPSFLPIYETSGNSQTFVSLMLLQVGVFFALGLTALCYTYRWRWGAGQRFVLTMPEWLRPTFSTSAGQILTSKREPSELRMLLWHNWMTTWKYAAFCLVALILTAVFLEQALQGPLVICLFLCAALMGVATFDGDHRLQRSRFWADRGVSIRKLLSAKLLVTGAPVCVFTIGVLTMMFLFGLESYQYRFWSAVLWLVLGCILAAGVSYGIGCLYSLACNRSVVAITAVICTLVAIAALWFSISPNFADRSPRWLSDNALAIFVLVSLPILCVTFVRMTRKWLVEGESGMFLRIAMILAASVILPLVISASTGFLFVRKTAWQGVNPSQLQPNKFAAPNIDELSVATGDLYLTDLQAPGFNRSSLQDTAVAWAETLEKRNPGDLQTQALENLNRTLASVSNDIASRADYAVVEDFRFAGSISSASQRVTMLGFLLVELREFESARHSLEIYRQLVELGIAHVPVETAASRAACLNAWQAQLSALLANKLNENGSLGDDRSVTNWLTEEKLLQLGTYDELRAFLVPATTPNQEQLARWLKASATEQMESLLNEDATVLRRRTYLNSPWLTKNFPPMRWRQERMLRLNLEQDLTTLQWQYAGKLPTSDPFTTMAFTNRYFIDVEHARRLTQSIDTLLSQLSELASQNRNDDQ